MRHSLMIIAALLAAWQVSASAAEGLPGATVKPESGTAAAPARAGAGERCQGDPAQCGAERQARRDKWCTENPEKCKEMRARAEQRREQCKANPEQCHKEAQARMTERFRKADTDHSGALSRAEAESGMPRMVRRFDAIDANRDGQITMDEIMAARKTRGSRKGSSL